MLTTLTTSELPPITYRHSRRAKRLRITIHPTKTIKVTIPKNTTLKQAKHFLHSKISWIKKQLQKIDELNKLQNYAKLPPLNKTKAKTILTIKLKELAEKYNFTYNKVYIRNQRTLWGSCSSKNNISLNMNIVSLPVELQDYVIMHELVHLKIRNHSRKFWAELDKLVGSGRAKEMRKELKGCGMRV